jgi:regulator of nucleoside diphosphate kinase
MLQPEITITRPDFERLGALFASSGVTDDAWVERLDEELARARVVAPESVPPDVVTMNSRVCFEDEAAGVTREITLVYPDEANAESARVSVLAPIGSALLGLRVGQSIEWPLPNGRRKRYRVVSVPYQPEASGHFDR